MSHKLTHVLISLILLVSNSVCACDHGQAPAAEDGCPHHAQALLEQDIRDDHCAGHDCQAICAGVIVQSSAEFSALIFDKPEPIACPTNEAEPDQRRYVRLTNSPPPHQPPRNTLTPITLSDKLLD